MRVGFLQYDVSHNIDENFRYLETNLSKQNCELLLLPELSLCGYLFQNREALRVYAEAVPAGAATQLMLALSKAYDCTIIFGLAEKENESIYNTAVIASKGRYIGKYRKIHLSDFEKKLFDRGSGNAVFEVDGLRIGVQICVDLWFPEISREQIRMDADILCVLANFGGETTYHISQIRAIENLTPLVLCNRVGAESIPGMDADFLGKSTVLDASGRQLCAAPAGEAYFGFADLPIQPVKGNVICSDFAGEMALHYPPPSEPCR